MRVSWVLQNILPMEYSHARESDYRGWDYQAPENSNERYETFKTQQACQESPRPGSCAWGRDGYKDEQADIAQNGKEFFLFHGMVYQTGIKGIDKGYLAEVEVHVFEENEDDDSREDVAYNGDEEDFEPGELEGEDAHGDGEAQLSDGGEGEEENFKVGVHRWSLAFLHFPCLQCGIYRHYEIIRVN